MGATVVVEDDGALPMNGVEGGAAAIRRTSLLVEGGDEEAQISDLHRRWLCEKDEEVLCNVDEYQEDLRVFVLVTTEWRVPSSSSGSEVTDVWLFRLLHCWS